HNRFYGGQFGAKVDWQREQWNWSLIGKIAFGGTQQLAIINGSSSVVSPNGASANAPGGTFALPSNSGRFFTTRFGVVPEVGLNLSYDLSDSVAVHLGYSFIYWSRVARVGQQLDRTVSLSQMPTDTNFGLPGSTNRPAFNFRESDFWMHGLAFGVEFKF